MREGLHPGRAHPECPTARAWPATRARYQRHRTELRRASIRPATSARTILDASALWQLKAAKIAHDQS